MHEVRLSRAGPIHLVSCAPACSPHPRPPSLQPNFSRHGVADPGPIQGPAPRRRPHSRCRRCRAGPRRDPRSVVPVPLPGRPVAAWARQGSLISPLPPLALCDLYADRRIGSSRARLV